MIIRSSSNDFDSLIVVISKIKNQTVFQAYQTFGTMFLFDLGKKFSKYSQGKLGFSGDYTVIIENNTWVLLNQHGIVCSSREDEKDIRKKIPVLIDEKIVDVIYIEQKNELIFVFSNYELKINLTGKKYRDIAIKLADGNWVEIGPNQNWRIVTGAHID